MITLAVSVVLVLVGILGPYVMRDAVASLAEDDTLPYALVAGFALVGCVGAAFKHSRYLWVAGVLASVSFGLCTPGRFEAPSLVLAVYGVPALLAAFALLPDRGVLTRSALPQLVATCVMSGTLLAAENMGPAMHAALMRALPEADAVLAIPVLALLVAMVAAVVPPLLRPAARVGAEVHAGLIVLLLVAVNAHPEMAGKALVPGATLWGSLAILVLLTYGTLNAAWRSAYTDELTGLPGRRAFQHRKGTLTGTYSMAMVDIDHFKKVNDTHGHDVGDEALRYVASHLSRVSLGTAYRYGGEEFVVVANASSKALAAALDDTREAIAKHRFQLRGPERKVASKKKRGRARARSGLSITFSAGVAERTEKRNAPDQVLAAADKALYRAKRGGRNAVHRSR